ncbi:hypothetical protein N7509_007263 [Penicillium cosmopolitanum]|uniref:Uncharacterized protein n=1 Tax=Penicillium cosmopolitanum TaxID=1131564 RepID=A0A9W9VYF4_9EURO|nr:uncharacterized protein N7509_007263 [Penicillium cosmopolitanum]KAJ5391773.1 hypothetical protein N7509_007263 [Penicillium cosmopolitanum]
MDDTSPPARTTVHAGVPECRFRMFQMHSLPAPGYALMHAIKNDRGGGTTEHDAKNSDRTILAIKCRDPAHEYRNILKTLHQEKTAVKGTKQGPPR